MKKRDFNNGYKSGIETIRDENYGYEFAKAYLAQKKEYINKFTEDYSVSYWAGYEQAIKESNNQKS